MNIEWIDQMISDVVGVVGELYTVSTKVVYNDALIDIAASLLGIFLVTILLFIISLGTWKLSKEVRAKEKDPELNLIVTLVVTAVILMIFCMSFISSYTTVKNASKKLTTPEWYALERIERLVK